MILLTLAGLQLISLVDFMDEALKLDIYPRELIAGELSRSCLVEIFAGRRLPVVSRSDAAGAKFVWISKGSFKSRRAFGIPPNAMRFRRFFNRVVRAPVLGDRGTWHVARFLQDQSRSPVGRRWHERAPRHGSS